MGNKDNLIDFSTSQKNSLTNDDIRSLFNGLVKLVMNNALENAENKYKKEISDRDEIIRKLTEENNLLMEKFEKLNHKIR